MTMKFLKFRDVNKVVHLTEGGPDPLCGMTGYSSSNIPVIYDNQPSGKVCAYCLNRKNDLKFKKVSEKC